MKSEKKITKDKSEKKDKPEQKRSQKKKINQTAWQTDKYQENLCGG